MPEAAAAPDLSTYTEAQLHSTKRDLEQRLARFQRAFFERHGRNPNEQEREPAKPAIRRYRAVCQELARREGQGKGERGGAGGAKGAIAEQAGQQGQVLGTTGGVREATRKAGEKDGKQEAASKAAEGTSGAAASSGVGDKVASQGGFLSKMGSAASTVMPSAAMCDLLVSWGQFTSIFGDLTQSITAELEAEIPNFSLPNLAPWAEALKSVWPYVNIFNLDLRSLQVNLDLRFLSSMGWRETHLAFTVIIPLIMSGVTILLLRNLTAIARLILFTASVLLLIFAAAAYAILQVAAAVRGEETTEIVSLNSRSLAYVAIVGGSGLFLSILLFAYRAHKTHSKIRDYLQAEVDDLTEKLYGVKEKLGGGLRESVAGGHDDGKGGAAAGKGGKVQEALPNADDLSALLEDDDDEEDGVHMVGGRAKDSGEFLRQMHERNMAKKFGHGPRVPQLASFIKTLVLWLAASLLALFFWFRYAEMLPRDMLQVLPDTHITTYYVLAVVFSALSGLILVYEVLTLTVSGQVFLDHFAHLLKAVYIGFLMIIVAMLYIPISRQALSVFICRPADCSQGQWFPLQSPGSEASLWKYLTQFASSYVDALDQDGKGEGGPGVNGSDAGMNALLTMRPASSCVPCQFLGGGAAPPAPPMLPTLAAAAYGGLVGGLNASLTNASSLGGLLPPAAPPTGSDWLYEHTGAGACPVELSWELCPPLRSMRLSAAPQIDCTQQWPFYLPGVLLTIVMFTIGVPYMFYNLTHRHVLMYESLDIYQKNRDEEAKMKQLARKGILHRASAYSAAELDDLWRRRVRRAVRNRAKNLYADFEYKWRYWKLVLLGFKFLIVVVDVLKNEFSSIIVAPMLMLIIHSSMLLLSTFARPYFDQRPDMLSIAISFANVFNWCLLLTTALQIRSPPFLLYAVLVVNLAFPILALFLGWYLNVRRERRLNKALAMKTNKRSYLPFPQVQKKRRMIERKINEFTLRVLASWTWGVLITSVIAGELIFIGTFAEAALTPVSGHTASTAGHDANDGIVDCYREEHAREREFLSFGSWSAFTESCCCMSRSNVTDASELDGHVTELWSCSNKGAATQMERIQRPIIYKERQRREMRPGTRVSPVRGFCETVFRDQHGRLDPGIQPRFDEISGKLGIYWYDDEGKVLQFHDDYW